MNYYIVQTYKLNNTIWFISQILDTFKQYNIIMLTYQRKQITFRYTLPSKNAKMKKTQELLYIVNMHKLMAC